MTPAHPNLDRSTLANPLKTHQTNPIQPATVQPAHPNLDRSTLANPLKTHRTDPARPAHPNLVRPVNPRPVRPARPDPGLPDHHLHLVSPAHHISSRPGDHWANSSSLGRPA
ncbi:hypothetical protein [Streptosporangium oxazolinicum]|uniref:hypothetical protein n=1 Tax=Streptosporangium oxazolinicum TaxID=909287 RepID=UPI0031E90FEF